MLVYLAIIAAIGAIAVAVRWWLNQYDAIGRRRKFPTVSVALLAVLAIALTVPTVLRHREESRLGEAASVLVGASASVHCQTFGQSFTDLSGDLGFVKFGADGVPEHHTTIKRGPCADLRHYYGSDKQHPSEQEIIAVHVLTHEAMHMRGQTDEAVTECQAMQRDSETAQLLGATPEQSLKLARAYWMIDYPNMPDAYRSEECRLGGSLDEKLPNPPWTTGAYPAVKLP